MANITEVSQWENVIRQIENGEAATGGADGLANVQAKQLANRTQWLKTALNTKVDISKVFIELNFARGNSHVLQMERSSLLFICSSIGTSSGPTYTSELLYHYLSSLDTFNLLSNVGEAADKMTVSIKGSTVTITNNTSRAVSLFVSTLIIG